MNKLEEIKKRYDGNAYKPYFIDLFGENKESFSTHNDIFYLLSIIEQAEKALESVANAHARETMRRYAEEALQAIRGN